MATILINKPNRHWAARFDSLPDLQRWLEATPRTWRGADESVSKDPRMNWDLLAGWQGALELARTGWHEGAERIHALSLNVAKPATSRAPRWGFDVAGDLPDVGRFLAGHPDSMRRRRTTQGRAPIVTIGINVNVPGRISAETMVNYGAAALLAIDQIEAAGRRVELYALVTNQFDKGQFAAAVRLKAADDPVDLGALAFGLAHPAMPRRLGFAVKERCALPTSWGYGGPIHITPQLLGDWPEGGLIIGGVREDDDKARTPEGALELLARQINAAAGQEIVTPA